MELSSGSSSYILGGKMNELIQNYGITGIVVCVIITITVFKYLWESMSWILDKLNLYHKKQSLSESNDERIAKLEKHGMWQYDTINQLTSDVKDIKDSIITMKEENNKITVATYRSTLWSLHKEFVCQGYTTKEDLKTFFEIGKIYEDCGGDDIYHDKLKPEVLKLPIESED